MGASTPITCGLGADEGWFPIQFDIRKFDEHVARTKEIANKCWSAQPDLLPHLTTRDMNVTQLFPRESDRMVFDSNLDPERAWRGAIQIWQLAAERGFDIFADWAAHL